MTVILPYREMMKNTTLEVRVVKRHYAIWDLRLKVAVGLISLAAWILDCQLEVGKYESSDTPAD